MLSLAGERGTDRWKPHPKPTLLERIGAILMREPEDREQLIELLRSSYERNLMDADALTMIEGVLQVSELQARDIMVPRAQMDVVDIHETPEQFLPKVIEAGHSRFPVIGESKDDVVGILLAKDLLRYFAGQEFQVREMLRPAVFIPESKRLNVLLRDFRRNRNHMAIVVDEYGGVAGLVTIEDVLEQIVGEIEDEYDFDETEANILMDRNGLYRVKAQTEIEDFNDTFGTAVQRRGVRHHRRPGAVEVRAPAQARRGDRDRRAALSRAARRQPPPARAAGGKAQARRMSAGPAARTPFPLAAGLGGALLLCAALGSASVLGFAPFYFWLVPVLSLAVLAWLVDQASGPRRAAMLGFCFGLGYFVTGVSWIYVSMTEFGGMAVPLAAFATLFFCSYLALFPAGAAWIARRLPAARGVRLTLAFPAAWVLTEWVRGWMFTGFPWLALGYSQSPGGPLAGFAPLLGVYGVSLLAALSAGLLAWWAPWPAPFERRRMLHPGSLGRGGPVARGPRPRPGLLDPSERGADHRQPAAGQHPPGPQVAARGGPDHAGDLSAADARQQQPSDRPARNRGAAAQRRGTVRLPGAAGRTRAQQRR